MGHKLQLELLMLFQIFTPIFGSWIDREVTRPGLVAFEISNEFNDFDFDTYVNRK